jgi:uncharacterized protein YjbI with pentapeptide repeats
MADKSQLSLIKQGVKAWNEGRQEHQLEQVKLSDVKLSGLNLSGANLGRACLRGANLSKADLSGANLREADLSGANLKGANLSKADLSGANLTGAEMSKANLRFTKLSEALLYDADLREADLQKAAFQRARLYMAILSKTDLRGADLMGADLSGADLRRADLSKTHLIEAILRKADLDHANFESAMVGNTIFGDVDLSSCSGIESILHLSPSTLGFDSIIRSKGRIPEIFLRGVGLPDEWITYIPSLVGHGIQFFSCFISYSSLDKPFALRLYDALQSKGIRCWLDEKQLLPGDDISRELERGIHLWDKFLLCASKNSLTSWWVEDEIKTTLEKERALRKERGKPVRKLIPLNLDGYMFSDKWELGVLANEIRSRIAADFQDREKPISNFDKQVDRVIKALRADDGAREKPPPSRL